jgi:hypothetical protein
MSMIEFIISEELATLIELSVAARTAQCHEVWTELSRRLDDLVRIIPSY